MSRVITFSRQFPAYHSKAGQPTHFVEKFWNAFHVDALGERFFEPFEEDLYQLNRQVPYDLYMDFRDSLILGRSSKFDPKYHTIRAGHRWNAGDKFSPRVWSGKPYNSKQVTIAPDIEIKKAFSFDIKHNTLFIDGEELTHSQWIELAKNDGLKVDEMLNWFRYPHEFTGQVICWSKDINY